MTIDEAIKHTEEVAKRQENNAKNYPRPDSSVRGSGKKYNAYLKCAEEHKQLAEWLKELKRLKEQEPCDDVCEWFEQYVDIVNDIVELRFSDGTVKRAKCGLYMRDIEKSIRKMLIDQIANEKKQEPCNDCISRQAVLDQTYLWSRNKFLRVTNPFDYLRKRINSLPSVMPAEKVGHWEFVQYDSNPNIGNWHCSECRTIIPHMPEETDNKPIYKWCPMCGSKMMQEVKK